MRVNVFPVQEMFFEVIWLYLHLKYIYQHDCKTYIYQIWAEDSADIYNLSVTAHIAVAMTLYNLKLPSVMLTILAAFIIILFLFNASCLG